MKSNVTGNLLQVSALAKLDHIHTDTDKPKPLSEQSKPFSEVQQTDKTHNSRCAEQNFLPAEKEPTVSSAEF